MKPDSHELIKDSDKNKMVTLGLSLHGSLSFKEICNQLTTTIEYDDRMNSTYSDIDVSDNKLVRRSNDNG